MIINKRKDVRRTMLILFVFLMSLTTLFSAQAPSFTIETLSGERIRSETLLEKGPIFLEFWSTTCEPCKQFLPHVNRFAKDYPEMSFVAVSIDRPRDRQAVVRMARRWSVITAFDGTRDLARLFSVGPIPRTIIINQEGLVVYDGTGYSAGDEAKFEEIIIGLVRPRNEAGNE